MNNRWEVLAKKNPYFYIFTDFKGDLTEFWKSGEKQAEEIFYEVKSLLINPGIVTEIGCGIGRVLIPMCSYFRKCIGVDISKTMTDLIKENAGKFGYANKIETFLSIDDWYKSKVDFIYSIWVFQHIERLEVIEDYIRKISGSLTNGGLAYLQFDTRPSTLTYRIRNKLPDFLLPRQWRKGVRRIRREPSEIIRLFKNYGLSILKEKSGNTENHIFILKKV